MTAKRFLIAMGLIAATAAVSSASAAPPGYDDPLPRVEDRLCPGVTGMRTDAALQIVDRVRHDAQRLGIPLDDPDTCKPNLMIFFIDDAGKALDSLMKQQGYLFGTLSTTERRALASDGRPVRAWSQIVTRSRDGLEIKDADNLVEVPRTEMWAAHSKIYVPVRRDILTTVVLFDNHAVVGKSPNQLADYAAMRAFANDFSVYPQDKRSILKLFDGDGGPDELTKTDQLFLKTLYSGIPNLPGQFKRRELANALEGHARQ